MTTATTRERKAGDNMDNRIFEYACKLSKKYGTRDPFDILEHCLPNTKLKISDRYEADGLKGYATIQVRGQKFAVINGKLCPEEQRVVAAHELGHLILHETHLKVAPMRDFDIYNALGKYERETNSFAADFLISDEEALDVIHSCDSDFFSSAKELCIPAPFFAFKLYSLIQRGNKLRMPVDLDSRFLAAGK